MVSANPSVVEGRITLEKNFISSLACVCVGESAGTSRSSGSTKLTEMEPVELKIDSRLLKEDLPSSPSSPSSSSTSSSSSSTLDSNSCAAATGTTSSGVALGARPDGISAQGGLNSYVFFRSHNIPTHAHVASTSDDHRVKPACGCDRGNERGLCCDRAPCRAAVRAITGGPDSEITGALACAAYF